jgi:MFS-type transporter involved in bile tolerance (Atg22 family)
MYFSKWFINDIGGTNILYNLIFFLSSLLIILLGRYLGRKVDKDGYKSRIRLAFGISAIALIALVISSQVLSGTLLIVLAFLFFMIFLFGYQMGRICHNTYLRGHIPEEEQSRMSGLGTVANWAGCIVGILIALPVVKFFAGQFGHEMALLVGTVAYTLLTPIAIALMARSTRSTMIHLTKETIDSHTRKSLLKTSGIFLLIYFLLFETMITVERNLPPYLDSMFDLSEIMKSLAFLVVVVFALVGGLIASKVVSFATATKWLKI